MKIDKKQMYLRAKDLEQNIKTIIEEDVIVRDVNPDILNVIEITYDASIADRRVEGEKVMIKGDLEYNILYVADEDDKSVHTMRGNIPFEEKFQIEDETGDVDVDCNVEYSQHSLINSRKLNMKCVINIMLKAENSYYEEVVSDISEDSSIQKITKNIMVNRKLDKIREKFLEKERYVVPANKPSISEVLKCDFRLVDTDVNIIGDELLITGNINIMMLYKSDEMETIDFIEFNMPVRETLPSDNTGDTSYDLKLNIESKNISITEDTSEENRVVNVEVILIAGISAIGSEEVCLLEDLYSLDSCLNVEKKDVVCDNIVSQNKNNYNIREIIKVNSRNIMQVYNVYADSIIDRITVKNNITEVNGVIKLKIIYVVADDNMPLNSFETELPFTQLIDTKMSKEGMKAQIDSRIENIMFNMLNPTEIEVRFEVCFNAKIINVKNETVICNIEIDEDKAPEKRDMNMIIFVASEDKRLWDIAKKYNTVTSNIRCGADSCELKPQTVIRKGEKLLIF